MARKNNKGYSIIEIIIAITILSLLLVPIVTQISQTFKTSRMAKQQQYVTDNAVYLMEDFQKSSMDELESEYGIPVEKADTVTCEVFDGTGATTGKTVKYHAYKYNLTDVNLGPEKKEYERYVVLDDLDTSLKGTVATGSQGYTMTKMTSAPAGFELNSEGFAVKYNTDGFVVGAICEETPLVKNPNDVNLGNMQNMDSSKVAIVPGTSANFDSQASKEFFALAMEDLRNNKPEDWKQAMNHTENDSVLNQQYSLDKNIKLTKIYIDKKTDTKDYYVVSVDVYYYNATLDETLSYNVFSQKFYTNECPATYFEYQPYAAEVGTGSVIYASNDYIVVDNYVPDAKIYLYRPQNDQMTATHSELIGYLEDSKCYTFYRQKGSLNTVDIHLCNLNNKDDAPSNVYTNIDTSIFDVTKISDDLFAEVVSNDSTAKGRTDYAGLKTLAEDERFQSRLYTINVSLKPKNDEAGSNEVRFTGAKGEN